jgi:four helix bundle protein
MALKSYKELTVWQRSIDLVAEIYKITKQLPKTEAFGLCSQMQRASVAIPSNIAEGYQRNHKMEYIQFLGIANASSAELETQLLITKRQYTMVDTNKANSLLLEIQKMLRRLIEVLKNH